MEVVEVCVELTCFFFGCWNASFGSHCNLLICYLFENFFDF